MAEDELELVQRSLDGDLEAWGEIVSRYKDAVYGVAIAILRNRADAEDAVQEAFIRAYTRLRQYDLTRRFSTWLLTVTANVARNMLRKRRPEPPQRFHWPEDPADVMREEQLRELVRKTVWSLPDLYREPLVLRYWHDMDIAEISEVLRMREGTVKTRLHRGRALVRAQLAEQGVMSNAL